MLKKLSWLALLAVVALNTGCALTRAEVKLDNSAALAQEPVTKKRIVLVRSVIDERKFEENPASPASPSLQLQGSPAELADARARAFGRKRNALNQPLGDVLLEKGQTVAGVVQDNVVAAFRKAGYRTTTDPAEAGPSPIVAEVHIKQLWAWVHFTFWSGTMIAEIDTNIGTGAAQPIEIKAHVEKSLQFVTEGDWVDMLTKALADFRTQLSAKAATLE